MSTDYKELEVAWLSPDGKVYSTPKDDYGHFESHVTHGGDIIDKLEPNNMVGDPIDWLENRGWIRLHSWTGTWGWVKSNRFKRLTKRQEGIIVDWCNANNIKWDDAFIWMN